MTSDQLRALFETAFQDHLAERLEAADAGYRHILQLDPEHGDALHLLGVILLQRGDAESADELMQQALRKLPEFPALHNNLGMALMARRQPAAAEYRFRQAILLHPDYADAWYNLGNALTELERYDEGKTAYQRALTLRPKDSKVLGNLGLLLEKAGNPDEAIIAYREALSYKPDDPMALLSLANLLFNLDRHGEAESCYQTLATIPSHAGAAFNGLGNIYSKRHHHQEAENFYRRSISLDPQDVLPRNNLAGLLQRQGRLTEAEELYRSAVERDPQAVAILDNHASCLRTLGRFDEAEAQHRRALALDPDYIEARINLGYLHQQRRQFDEAEQLYLDTLARRPGHSIASINLSLLRLAQGRLAEAWPYFEARLDNSHELWSIHPPEADIPSWRGEPLFGKSIVIWHEQGLGDEIIFCRFAYELKKAGAAWVSLVCKPPLKTLLQTLEGPDVILSDGDRLETHDFWVFPMTAPALLGITLDTIPARIPYLHARPEWIEKWRSKLPNAGLKVGLVWRGEPRQPNNATRSLDSLHQLAPLWRVPGVSFISLQKGEGEVDAMNPPPDQPLIHLGGELADFSDTAGIVAQLDLVITICTATAHLAGAMGKPCWVLTPAMHTFWLWFLDRTDSPWYPGVVRLFRQTRPLDWSETIEQVALALEDWSAKRL